MLQDPAKNSTPLVQFCQRLNPNYTQGRLQLPVPTKWRYLSVVHNNKSINTILYAIFLSINTSKVATSVCCFQIVRTFLAFTYLLSSTSSTLSRCSNPLSHVSKAFWKSFCTIRYSTAVSSNPKILASPELIAGNGLLVIWSVLIVGLWEETTEVNEWLSPGQTNPLRKDKQSSVASCLIDVSLHKYRSLKGLLKMPHVYTYTTPLTGLASYCY